MWIDLHRVTSLHERYLEAIGRALAVAQHFDSTLRFVLTCLETVHSHRKRKLDDFSALQEIHDRVKKLRLKETVGLFGKLGKISQKDASLLDNARNTRNYLAHEAATAISEFPDRPDEIAKRIRQLRNRVHALASADNIVSSWSYTIQEKDLPPRRIRDEYTSTITSWIMLPIDDR